MNPVSFVKAREEASASRFAAVSSREFLRRRLAAATNLYHKNLLGHFGCVNAVEFSPDGALLASGGDDRRVLLWNLAASLDSGEKRKSFNVMKGLHNSNIFCLDFDRSATRVYSGGNDEQVLAHDLLSGGRTLDVLPHDEPVYGVSVSPADPGLLATACSDGSVQLFDLRAPDGDPTIVAGYSDPFHAVVFNPADPRLLAAANHRHGLGLWDLRRPRRCVLEYGNVAGTTQNAMSVRFDDAGRRILGLRRRLPPVLYDIESPEAAAEFDYPGYYNSCTMKSCSFAGPDDEYVMSGSDDFNLYVWRSPPLERPRGQWVDRAHLVLSDHRSIVNQVRFNKQLGVIASAGVEKVIKLWSVLPLPGGNGDLDLDGAERPNSGGRSVYSRDEYLRLVLQSGTFMSHDYSSQSTEENPRMMAFFDSLVQREIEGSSSGDEGTGEGGGALHRLLLGNNDDERNGYESVDMGSRSNRGGENVAEESGSPTRKISYLIAKKRRQLMVSDHAKRMRRSRVNKEYVRRSLANARRVLASTFSSSSSETESSEEESDKKSAQVPENNVTTESPWERTHGKIIFVPSRRNGSSRGTDESGTAEVSSSCSFTAERCNDDEEEVEEDERVKMKSNSESEIGQSIENQSSKLQIKKRKTTKRNYRKRRSSSGDGGADTGGP